MISFLIDNFNDKAIINPDIHEALLTAISNLLQAYYIHAHAHTHAHMRACTCTQTPCIHTFTHSHMHSCVHAHM